MTAFNLVHVVTGDVWTLTHDYRCTSLSRRPYYADSSPVVPLNIVQYVPVRQRLHNYRVWIVSIWLKGINTQSLVESFHQESLPMVGPTTGVIRLSSQSYDSVTSHGYDTQTLTVCSIWLHSQPFLQTGLVLVDVAIEIIWVHKYNTFEFLLTWEWTHA